MSANHHHHADDSLAGKVLENTGVKAARCYQCGKCSAGCPVAVDMDFPPSQVLRLLQTGEKADEELVLTSKSIWYCLTCEMCIARCPQEVDIPPMMDYLRGESMRQGKTNPAAKNIIKFHKAFLDSIEQTGRLYELGLVVDYKMRSLKLFQDIGVMVPMISRGKLNFLPELIKNRANVKMIFKRTINKEKK